MKIKVAVIIFLSLTVSVFSQEKDNINTNALLGEWKLDMSPHNKNDNNFAIMQITSVDNNKIKGTFYRKGVEIKNGKTNTLSGKIYAALTSGDYSGEYNTSFYLDNGKLYGTTHALKRDFLAVWVAEKIK